MLRLPLLGTVPPIGSKPDAIATARWLVTTT
jgi:hypothetical protein